MKGWANGFGIACAFVAFLGYGVPFLHVNETTITQGEIIIGRVTGFAETTKYALDVRSGDERVIVHRHPWLFGEEVILSEYKSSCSCVANVGISRGEENYIVVYTGGDTFRQKSGTVFKRDDDLHATQLDPRYQEAVSLLKGTRVKFAKLLPDR